MIYIQFEVIAIQKSETKGSLTLRSAGGGVVPTPPLGFCERYFFVNFNFPPRYWPTVTNYFAYLTVYSAYGWGAGPSLGRDLKLGDRSQILYNFIDFFKILGISII